MIWLGDRNHHHHQIRPSTEDIDIHLGLGYVVFLSKKFFFCIVCILSLCVCVRGYVDSYISSVVTIETLQPEHFRRKKNLNNNNNETWRPIILMVEMG